jgi:alpha-L-fucosidase
LLLNVPPDRRGLIADVDVDAIAGMRRLLEDRYRNNLARGAPITLDTGANVEGSFVTDENLNTHWFGSELTLSLPRQVRFDRVVLQEPIALGQRIAKARIDAWVNGSWTSVAEITTVGYKRIVPVADTTTDRVRVRVLDSRAEPMLAELGLYSSAP